MIPFRKQSPAAPAPAGDSVLPVVVFGRPSGARTDTAGLFEGKAATDARQAAEAQKLGWFSLDTPERQQAAQGLEKGGFVTPGRFDLKAIDGARLAVLQGLAAGGIAAEPPEWPQGGVLGAAEAAKGPGDGAAAAPAAAEPAPSPTGEAAAPSPWRRISTDDIVLAPSWVKRQFEGYWEARVVGFDGDDVMLEWKGYEKMPRFWLKRAQIALLHPEYSSPQ